MNETKIDKRAETINIKADSDKEFLLIHGYTGSPTDFGDLGQNLHKTLNCNVKIPRLRGHGKTIKSLDNLTFNDFLKQVEDELKKDLKKGRKIIIGGYSFGGSLALYLASKYPVAGAFGISVPYKLKFPFNIKGLVFLGLFKKYWKKIIPHHEKKLREKAVYYDMMHSNGLDLTLASNRYLNKSLIKIDCPTLLINSNKGGIDHFKSAAILEGSINSKIKKSRVIKSKSHSIFFSKQNNKITNIIESFFKKNRVFEKQIGQKSETVAAIVPSYNESKRIGTVLKTLTQTKLLKEIVVIDDGSSDNTQEIVKKFDKVKYLRNKKNIGKGYSMQRGVDSTKSEILFFCDADLKGLTPEIVESIIEPVMDNKVDMSIGIRNNKMQNVFKSYALNSGERALRRDIWENVSGYYKRRYGTEVGLNNFVRKYGKGFGYKRFDYYQTLKEKKYGLINGTLLRWHMNIDFFFAYLISRLKKY